MINSNWRYWVETFLRGDSEDVSENSSTRKFLQDFLTFSGESRGKKKISPPKMDFKNWKKIAFQTKFLSL